ncbi:hypothetical protein ACNKHW_25705 [Shigella flexneri]
MKAMIEAGAAAVHFEDQLASAKKCGHMGGKGSVPTQEAIQKPVAAPSGSRRDGRRPSCTRTDADAADLITSDCDPYDSEFFTGERTSEGSSVTRAGTASDSRRLAYAPYADLVWCGLPRRIWRLARRFAQAIHARYPGELLAYNCSPSFNWQKNLHDKTIASFQRAAVGYGLRLQFITLAGIHSMWFDMFDLANAYAQGEGMRALREKCSSRDSPPQKMAIASYLSGRKGTGYFDK